MHSLQFLIEFPLDLYMMVVLLRLWLQWVRADFYNPFSQFIVKATNPLLRPLRRVIPGLGGFDLSSLVLVFLVSLVKYVLLYAVLGGGLYWPMITIQSVVNMFSQAFDLVTYVLILRAVLSWVSQGYSPIEMVLNQLTEPMLAPIRRIIPPIGGLDLSILVLFFIMFFMKQLTMDILTMMAR